MISLNKATLIGNITRDPELRYTPSGQGVCNFSIATNRRYKNAAGDLQEETQYHDIVAWGKVAEIISQIVKKGNKMYVEGRLQTRQWDAPDGTKRSRTEVVLDQFIPLTPKSSVPYEAISKATSEEIPVEKSAGQSPLGGASAKPVKKTAKAAKTETPEPTPVSSTEADPSRPAGQAEAEEINLDDIPF